MNSRLLSLVAFAFAAQPKFLLAADKGGDSGGTAKSPVDELADLRASVKSLTDARDAHAKTIDALNADIDSARKSATAAKDELKVATDKITKLETDAKAATDKITKLEADAKTADQLATEKAAAHGVVPAPKEAAKLAAGTKDLQAIYDEYQSLTGREKTAFLKSHAADLDAYAKAHKGEEI